MKSGLRTLFSQALFRVIPARAYRARTALSGRYASTPPIRYPGFPAGALRAAGV